MYRRRGWRDQGLQPGEQAARPAFVLRVIFNDLCILGLDGVEEIVERDGVSDHLHSRVLCDANASSADPISNSADDRGAHRPHDYVV
jgi:hypothetical protein